MLLLSGNKKSKRSHCMTEPCGYLVVGASGYVGKALYRACAARRSTRGTYCHGGDDGDIRLDITDESSVTRVIAGLRPRSVICAAAVADVDECARNPERSRLVNAAGAQNLSRACAVAGATLVYLSTDYVFDGRHGPYSEDESPGPINTYGEHKAAGERSVLEIAPHPLVVRTSTVFGGSGNERGGLIAKLLHAARNGAAVALSPEQLCSPTSIDDLVDGILGLIDAGCRGIYHIAGAEICSRYDFGRMIGAGLGVSPELLQKRNADPALRAMRPLRCGLLNHKAERDIGYRPRPIAAAVDDATKDLAVAV